MPLEGLDEEGLPKNPDLGLVQLKFLLTVGDELGADKEKVWEQLLTAIKENCELLPRSFVVAFACHTYFICYKNHCSLVHTHVQGQTLEYNYMYRWPHMLTI